jgi:hypothetical protein
MFIARSWIFPFIIGWSCSPKPIQTLPQWTEMVIRTDNQDISIPKDTSSCYSKTWEYKDSIMDDGERWRIPVQQQLVKFKLSPGEKDSAYNFITDLINKPNNPSAKCSDYVGNVTFRIYYDQYSKSCSYSSVCRWQNINIQTLKISGLLQSKINLVNE